MAIIYVSKTGNDSTGNGSVETPYLTIGKAITVATAGDTISVGTGTYAELVTINKSLTLTPSSGVKGDAKISSAANTLTISHTTNNVTIDKMEIISSGTNHNAITVNKNQSFTPNASGLPVLASLCDNINITNCNIIYAKYGIAFNGKNSTISNNTFTQNVNVSNTPFLIYSIQDLTISSNTYTSHLGTVSRVFYLATAGAGEYRSGTLTIINNTITVTNTASNHFIIHEMNRNHPTDKMRYYIEGNNYTFPQAGTPGFLVLAPAAATNPVESVTSRIVDMLNYTNKSIIRNNVVTNPHRGWIYVDIGLGQIVSGGNTFFRVSGNTYTGTLSYRAGTYDVDNTGNTLVSATPADTSGWNVFYETILNPVTYIKNSGNDFNLGAISGFPVLTFPKAVKITENNGTISVDENVINGLPGNSGNNVNLKKLTPVAGVNTESITDFTVKLDTSSNGNPNIVHLIELRQSTRPTIDGKTAPFQLTTKFVDVSTEQVLTNITHTYEVTLDGYANRQYMIVYRENGTETPDFVTNANLKEGEINVYTFTLNTNSTYTFVDPGLMNLGAGAGSDPHIKTIYGSKYDLPNLTKWWNLLTYQDLKIKGHTTGYAGGAYYFNEAEIKVGSDTMKIDFNKQKIKTSSPIFKPLNIKDNNTNLAKSKKNIHGFYINKYDGLYLVIDLANKYIIPLFNRLPEKGKASGVLIEK